MQNLDLELMENQKDDNGCNGISKDGKSTVGEECVSTRTHLNKKII